MKNYIFLSLLLLFSFSLLGQQGLLHTEVTVLMKNRSKLKGVIKYDQIYTLHLKIDGETYQLKKKDIIAVIPGDLIIEDLAEKALQKDLIVLKSKVWLSGEIVEIQDKSVEFKMENSIHTVRLVDIIKIYPKGQKATSLFQDKNDANYVKPLKLAKLNKQNRKDGLYHIIYGNLATRNSLLTESSLSRNSPGIQYIIGYQLSQNIGLGLGIGYLDYVESSIENRPKFVPVFAEARGYFSEKKVSAYYNLAIGYTLGAKNDNAFLINSRPMLYTHPAIGYKIGSDRVAVLIDLGVQLSKIEYEYDIGESPGGIIFTQRPILTLDSRRVVLRLGIMF